MQTYQEQVPYSIKVSRRARHMRISVGCDAAVTVTLPWGISESAAEKFVRAKTAWILRAREYYSKFQGRMVFKSGKREYLKHKQAAFNLAAAKVQQWNRLYNHSYNRISIRNAKSRWGSCSKKGNLNFNYKIVHLPEPLLDYLVVHELCHLKEFNHSRNFWKLVGQAVPEYKKLRKELRNI